MTDIREFFEGVYKIVARIPPSKVMTYGQIALWLGSPKMARWVGRALYYAADESLPCHRVVRASGELAPSELFGGRQRRMLEAEGVTFRPNGRVDLALCRYREIDG